VNEDEETEGMRTKVLKVVTDLANRMKIFEDPAKAMKELKEWVKNCDVKAEQWRDLRSQAKILGVKDVSSRRNFHEAAVRAALLCF